MKEFRNISVWELLNIMQRKVKYNAEKIRKNLESVKIVRKDYSQSTKREKVISFIYKKNTDLTNENMVLLGLHNSMFTFYKEFKDLLNETKETVISNNMKPQENPEGYRKFCIEESISGNLKINNYHPFINDQDFFNELMAQCESMELYERCAEIKSFKEALKVQS